MKCWTMKLCNIGHALWNDFGKSWVNDLLFEMNGPTLFQGKMIKKIRKYIKKLQYLLFQNHWANFNQTWHITFQGEWNYSLFKLSTTTFSKGKLLWNSGNTSRKIKIVSSMQNNRPISFKLGAMYFCTSVTVFFSNNRPFNSQMEMIIFFPYNFMA